IAARAALTANVLDEALGAISGLGVARAERTRTWWLALSSVLVFAGGAALVALVDVAAPLFALNALGQASYLFVVAPRFLDPADPPDHAGRRQTFNAFIVYLAATSLVLWAEHSGRLSLFREADWRVLSGVFVATAALAIYVVWHLSAPWSRKTLGPEIGRQLRDASDTSSSVEGAAADVAGDQGDAGVRGVLVKAEPHRSALHIYQLDRQGDIAPESLGLSPALTRDLLDWAEAIAASVPDVSEAPSQRSAQQHTEHAAMARRLAQRLACERPDLAVYVETDDWGIEEVNGGGAAGSGSEA
ncbi:MAG: hypothetical protein ACK4MF_01655, partial [Hyphomicrobiaceae bacterium]